MILTSAKVEDVQGFSLMSVNGTAQFASAFKVHRPATVCEEQTTEQNQF